MIHGIALAIWYIFLGTYTNPDKDIDVYCAPRQVKAMTHEQVVASGIVIGPGVTFEMNQWREFQCVTEHHRSCCCSCEEERCQY